MASSKSVKTPKEMETSKKTARPLRPVNPVQSSGIGPSRPSKRAIKDVKSIQSSGIGPSRPSKQAIKEKTDRKKDVSPSVSLPAGFFKIYDVLRYPSAHPGTFIDIPTFPSTGGSGTRPYLRYRAIRATTQPGFLVFGQYDNLVGAGSGPAPTLAAVFSIIIDNNTFDDAYVGILDVTEDGNRVISKRILTRKDFPEAGKPVRFAVPFNLAVGAGPGPALTKLEFRLYYLGYTYMAIRFICIVDANVPIEQIPPDEELGEILEVGAGPGPAPTGRYVYNLKARGYDLYNETQKLVLTGYSTYMWTDMSYFPWDGPYKGMTPGEYAEIIASYNANITRVFCIDTWTSSLFPWARVGATGKFDLNTFDPVYMENLKNLVQSFGNFGIIVVLDLFDNVALWDTPTGMTWRRHPFNAANGGPIANPKDGRPEFYNPNPEVRALQENYIRYMVDSLREYKNIIFEVCNEYNMGGGASWHNWVADVIKSVNPEVLISASLEVDRPGYWDVWSYKNTDIIYDHTGGWVSRDFKTIWKNYVTIKLKEPGKPVILSTDGCEENYPAQHRDMVNAAKFAIDQNCGIEFKDLYEPVAQEVKAFAVPLTPAGTV